MVVNLLKSAVSYGVQAVLGTVAPVLGRYIGPFDGGIDTPEMEQKLAPNHSIGDGPEAESISVGVKECPMVSLSYKPVDFNFAARAWGWIKIIGNHSTKDDDLDGALAIGDTTVTVVGTGIANDKQIQIGTDDDGAAEVVNVVSGGGTVDLVVSPPIRNVHDSGTDVFILTDTIITSTITVPDDSLPQPITMEYPIKDTGSDTFVRQCLDSYLREFEASAKKGDFNPKFTIGIQPRIVTKTSTLSTPTKTGLQPFNVDAGNVTLTAWGQSVGTLVGWKIKMVRTGKLEHYMTDSDPQLPQANDLGFVRYELEADVRITDDTYFDLLTSSAAAWTLKMSRDTNDYIQFTTSVAYLSKNQTPYPDDAMAPICHLSGECTTISVEVKVDDGTLIP